MTNPTHHLLEALEKAHTKILDEREYRRIEEAIDIIDEYLGKGNITSSALRSLIEGDDSHPIDIERSPCVHVEHYACLYAAHIAEPQQGYRYVVTTGGLTSHTAFDDAVSFRKWLDVLGLSLSDPSVIDTVGSQCSIVGHYEKHCYRGEDAVGLVTAMADYTNAVCEIPLMDGSRYTRAIVRQEGLGYRSVHFVNINERRYECEHAKGRDWWHSTHDPIEVLFKLTKDPIDLY